MNKTIKQIAMALVPTLIMGLSSCKDKTDDNNTQPTKTLNKTSLTNNKSWYNKGGTINHVFKSNGDYGSANQGNWRWVNNSDTMEIDYDNSNTYVKWKMNWNTDTEMECEWIGNGGARTFKTTQW